MRNEPHAQEYLNVNGMIIKMERVSYAYNKYKLVKPYL
jgi:hypothetical protein